LRSIIVIKDLRLQLQDIIDKDRTHLLKGLDINKNFVKRMGEREQSFRNKRKINNWLLIFNWEDGTFQNWVQVQGNPNEATEQYSSYEKNWPFQDGFEVVLVGAQKISTIEKTHSHYFGFNTFDKYLKDIGVLPNKEYSLSTEALLILHKLYRKNYWGSKKVSIETLKNHFCKGIDNLPVFLMELYDKKFIIGNIKRGSVSLNINMKILIEDICA